MSACLTANSRRLSISRPMADDLSLSSSPIFQMGIDKPSVRARGYSMNLTLWIIDVDVMAPRENGHPIGESESNEPGRLKIRCCRQTNSASRPALMGSSSDTDTPSLQPCRSLDLRAVQRLKRSLWKTRPRGFECLRIQRVSMGTKCCEPLIQPKDSCSEPPRGMPIGAT